MEKFAVSSIVKNGMESWFENNDLDNYSSVFDVAWDIYASLFDVESIRKKNLSYDPFDDVVYPLVCEYMSDNYEYYIDKMGWD